MLLIGDRLGLLIVLIVVHDDLVLLVFFLLRPAMISGLLNLTDHDVLVLIDIMHSTELLEIIARAFNSGLDRVIVMLDSGAHNDGCLRVLSLIPPRLATVIVRDLFWSRV